MPLRLGVGIGVPFGGNVFSPAALFAAGEAGFWGEVTTADLWQDTARTTPVTAAGQAVASWRLRTASGFIYAEQATAGNRPLYQLDGSRGFLEFDGATSNRWLQTAAVDFSANNKITVIAGIRKASDAARATVFQVDQATSRRLTIEAPGFNVGSDRYQLALWAGTVVNVVTTTGPAPETAVITGLGDAAAPSTILRRNGLQVGSSTSSVGASGYPNAAVFIGRGAGGTQPFNGRIYGLIMRGALTAGATLTSAERWMNERTGAF